MATFTINLNNLNEFQSKMNSNHQTFLSIKDQVFNKVIQVKNIWNDPNTPVFIDQIKLDNKKIEEYNDCFKQVNNAVLEFTNQLINIAKKCNFTATGIFQYNGNNAKNMIENCHHASNLIHYTHDKLNYLNIPSTYRYAYQLRNIKYQLLDINNMLKSVSNDLTEVTTSIENAFQKIQSLPKIEPINLKQMQFVTNTVNVDLIDSESIINEATSSQKLNVQNSNLKYTEQESTFQNNSQTKTSKNTHNLYEEADSTFVNEANHAVKSETPLSFEYDSSTFTNNSQIHSATNSTVENNLKEEQLNLNNANKTSVNSATIEHTNIKSEINNSEEVKVSDNNININKTGNFINNTEAKQANDISIEINQS